MQKQGAKVNKILTRLFIVQNTRINVKIYLSIYQHIKKSHVTFLRKLMRKKQRKH